MHAFGISNNSPDQALSFLLKRGVVTDMGEVAIVVSGTRLKPNVKPVRNILFILSVGDIYRNLEVLNSRRYAATQVFIFASPLRINELSNVTPLDFEAHPAVKGLGFLLKKEINLTLYRKHAKLTDNLHVSRLNTQYLTLLTDNVKRGSLLNPLMTFLYTLPSSTHQTPVKEAVAEYLYKGLKFEKLELMLDEVRGVVISRRIRDKLCDILSTEIGESYKAAFKEYRLGKEAGKIPVWASLCKKHGTSDYELKYLKSIVDNKASSKAARGKTLAALQKQAA